MYTPIMKKKVDLYKTSLTNLSLKPHHRTQPRSSKTHKSKARPKNKSCKALLPRQFHNLVLSTLLPTESPMYTTKGSSIALPTNAQDNVKILSCHIMLCHTRHYNQKSDTRMHYTQKSVTLKQNSMISVTKKSSTQ